MKTFKTNSLFRAGEDANLNACVGPNGGPYDAYDYALGYFRAGIAILTAAESGKLPVDVAVYPMVYNFRHAVELSLKHFAKRLPPLFREKGVPKLRSGFKTRFRRIV